MRWGVVSLILATIGLVTPLVIVVLTASMLKDLNKQFAHLLFQ